MGTRPRPARFLLVLAAMAGPATASPAQQSPETDPAAVVATVDLDAFFEAASLDPATADAALERIGDGWRDGYASMLVDLVDLLRRTSLVDPRSWIRVSRLVGFLERQTGQRFGTDFSRWRDWVWSRPYEPHPGYGTFKGVLYGQLDPRFADFFQTPLRTAIRLDEMEWGGVGVNGIPPLEYPATVPASEASYLEDDHVVFGVVVGDQARAYPKRILAWHELAQDRLGDREVTLVYCTLCGTVIPYDSRVGGEVRIFGTSGLLYQSNKLMFDAGTRSLWSSLEGIPVVGPLVGSGLRLDFFPVVTTTWGEWRRRHPETTVLSLDTGFQRDYSEGEAYRMYFSTDQLMFRVSRLDDRLANKAEVLALRPDAVEGLGGPVAVAAGFLRAHPVYHLDPDGQRLVIVTSPGGANRVYRAGSTVFEEGAAESTVVDSEDRTWRVTETGLEADEPGIAPLPRVPAHRVFWFAWYAQYPDTGLIGD